MCVFVFPYQIDGLKGEVLKLYQVIKFLTLIDSDNGADYQAPAAGLRDQRWLV